MNTAHPTEADRGRFVRAREIGRQQSHDRSAVVHARYDTRLHGIELEFRSGATMTIPKRLVAALDGASLRDLVSVSVSPAGDAVSWRSLDVDLDVPGLVEHAFGRGLFESFVAAAPAETPDANVLRPVTPITMSEAEASRYIGMSAGWLKKSRTRRFRTTIDAPPFVRAGTKRIVYRREDLDLWLEDHLERLGSVEP